MNLRLKFANETSLMRYPYIRRADLRFQDKYQTSWLGGFVLWKVSPSETGLETDCPDRGFIRLLCRCRATLRQYVKIFHGHFHVIYNAICAAIPLIYVYKKCDWNRVFRRRVISVSFWNRKQNQVLKNDLPSHAYLFAYLIILKEKLFSYACFAWRANHDKRLVI